MKLLIDCGGTYIRYSIGNDVKKIKNSNIDIVDFIEDKIKKYTVDRVGLSFAGQVNNGIILSSPNIKVKEGFDIKNYFEKNYDVELILENDLKCAALAEAQYHNKKNIAVLYVGTGFGAAFIEDGRMIRGYMNLSGEIGHIPYKPTPFMCSCGKNNCLELTCSGKAMSLRGINTLEDDSGFRLEFNNALNYAIEIVSVLLNPEVLVLGGGVIEYNDVHIKPKLPKFTKVDIQISSIKNAAIEGLRLLMKSEVRL
jgi:predicted NBD/HSP70 family sugar kinase